MIAYFLDLIDKWFPQKEVCIKEEEEEVANVTESSISEPVISMVEYFKKNYRTFSWYRHDPPDEEEQDVLPSWNRLVYPDIFYTFVDNKNGIVYSVVNSGGTSSFLIGGKEAINLFTPEEEMYIVDEVKSFLIERANRLHNIKLQRATRASSRKRAELLKIYCD